MRHSLKSPLLLSAMLSATLGLTACSSPSSESTDSTATDSAATDTAADKLGYQVSYHRHWRGIWPL